MESLRYGLDFCPDGQRAGIRNPDRQRPFYNDSYAYLSGFPPDQSASATILQNPNATSTDGWEIEILVRWSDSANSPTGYECNLEHAGGGLTIVRWNGPSGDFTVLAGATNQPISKTGDIFTANIVGNVITVYFNGVQVLQATDSTYATGNPGMGFFVRDPALPADFGFSSFTATGL